MDESVVVAPSADNGNIPVDAPSEPQAPATPAEPVEPAKPAEPVQQLYELPDGRKVDGHTLVKEWKENFLPDYTRKSQELAKNKPEAINNPKPADSNPYADPNYVPKHYDEVITAAEQRVFEKLEAKQREEKERAAAIETEVSNQIEAVKKIDPSVNIDSLFAHATKYGFRDLSIAYQNMKDMNLLIKTVQQTTVKNMEKKNDPVSTTQGRSNGNMPDRSQYSNARDFYRSLSK